MGILSARADDDITNAKHPSLRIIFIMGMGSS
jgi:hypothetical protein